jgi:DNA-directed RNA polymerase subunit A"
MEDKVMAFYETIKESPIQGITNIKQTSVKQHKVNYSDELGNLKTKDITCINTEGTNLFEVMGILNIDYNNVISSSIGDVNEILGIEAARNTIINETASFTDSCDLTHVSIIADEMVRTGKYTSVESAGLTRREPKNALLRMAFGSPIQVAANAALYNIKNPVHGLACRQELGLLPNIGTKYNEIILDQEFMHENSLNVNSFIEGM